MAFDMADDSLITSKELAGFENLLSSVNVDTLTVTAYSKRYLQHIIGHKNFYCRIYAQLLTLALQNCKKKKEEICLLDYGAGNGLMGLLAKYCGFEKVFLNDLSADFLDAAKELSKAMAIQPDGFIEGDIENVKTYFSSSSPDVIVGSDVIEHIYNLNDFFKTVKEINPEVIIVMSTACNPANYFKTKQFQKLQIKEELEGGSPGDHALFGEAAIEPFIEMRRKIIAAYAQLVPSVREDKLNKSEVNNLAMLTRGLRKDDIEKVVEKYITSKILPVPLSHPTNTCDPVTGSWSERLLSFDEYKMIYAAAGFAIEFYDGFYNEYEATIKSRLLFFVNRLISLAGFRVSPFITLVGKP
jgi:2-polyprenyl-3-methyl-5-hydroxy-6-metoxy-1,4-benzoquinol methylase